VSEYRFHCRCTWHSGSPARHQLYSWVQRTKDDWRGQEDDHNPSLKGLHHVGRTSRWGAHWTGDTHHITCHFSSQYSWTPQCQLNQSIDNSTTWNPAMVHKKLFFGLQNVQNMSFSDNMFMGSHVVLCHPYPRNTTVQNYSHIWIIRNWFIWKPHLSNAQVWSPVTKFYTIPPDLSNTCFIWQIYGEHMLSD
jgi:hypothetical protein